MSADRHTGTAIGVRLDDEQLADLDAVRGDMSRAAYLAWAFKKARALRLVPTPSTQVDTPRAAAPGFVGSKLPGHADVPELGWYRPSSAEAKAKVKVDPHMLELAKAAGAGSDAKR